MRIRLLPYQSRCGLEMNQTKLETITDLLDRARHVTGNYFDNGAKWTIDEQLNHVHSEVSELYQSRRKCPNCKMPPLSGDGAHCIHCNFNLREHRIDEICDIIFSSLTLGHLLQFRDDELLAGIEKCLLKIERRSQAFADRMKP